MLPRERVVAVIEKRKPDRIPVYGWLRANVDGMIAQAYGSAGAFAIMGGLDVQTTIGFGDYDKLRRDIERVLRIGADGRPLFCTSHFVQSRCTMEELKFAYDLVFELVRKPPRAERV